MGIVYATLGVFALLVICEYLWRSGRVKGETGRKLVHISVGSFVAFWPYFMTWRQIQFMALAFLVVVVLSQQRNIFKSIHQVRRRTWGEIFFPIGIGLAAFIEPSPLIFAAAILHLSLADGLAAVVGCRYGMGHQYKVHNYEKTIAGSLTFWLISTVIVALTVLVSAHAIDPLLLPVVVLLPMAATLVENFSPGGIDNVFVPLLVIVVLQAVGL